VIHQSLTNEPVSSTTPDFHELIDRAFANHQPVVLLLRYANCGGMRDYFIARSPTDFQAVLKHAKPKTSITVFFESSFMLVGTADDDLRDRTVGLFPIAHAQCEGVHLIRVNPSGVELDAELYVYAKEFKEIEDWFERNRGASVMVGTMEYWRDNCSEIVTVYVPDVDGVARPGAY
jgi:hypothetical protein